MFGWRVMIEACPKIRNDYAPLQVGAAVLDWSASIPADRRMASELTISFGQAPVAASPRRKVINISQVVRPGDRLAGLGENCLETLFNRLLGVKTCRVTGPRALHRPLCAEPITIALLQPAMGQFSWVAINHLSFSQCSRGECVRNV